jgi:hypothetical protein
VSSNRRKSDSVQEEEPQQKLTKRKIKELETEEAFEA